MKKLIKQSELYESFKNELSEQEYCEVFINPTDKEIRDTINSDCHNSLRGVIYEDGTKIIWPGSIIHNFINKFIKNPIDIQQYRFSYNEYWFIDANDKTVKDVMNNFVENIDFFKRIGNINADIEISYAQDINDLVTTIKTFEHDYNYYIGMTNRIAKRLIKQSELYDSYKRNEEYCEVFINPTDKEIRDTINSDYYKTIRGMIYKDGTKIIWPGSQLHDVINDYAKKQIDVTQFRFAYGSRWFLDAYDKPIKDVMDEFKKNIDFLKRIGNVNAEIQISYSKEISDIRTSLNNFDKDYQNVLDDLNDLEQTTAKS